MRGRRRNVRGRSPGSAAAAGLSNTVMRLIEQRTAGDKVLLWGGMAGTLLIMALIWYYLG